MVLTRQDFIAGLGALATPRLPRLESGARIKAIAFDAFPILDPRPVFLLAETLFPGQGARLGEEWRTRQFEYTWLRTSAHRYADFWQVTGDALEVAAARTGVALTAEKRARLMEAYLHLKTWPDALPALEILKAAGLRMAFLSNLTPAMLEAAMTENGLHPLIAHAISTDRARTFKPDPSAYRLGPEAFGLRKEEILFVAFAGWDAAGAKLYGYPTFWLNRQNAPAEKLGAAPDGAGPDMTALLGFLGLNR